MESRDDHRRPLDPAAEQVEVGHAVEESDVAGVEAEVEMLLEPPHAVLSASDIFRS